MERTLLLLLASFATAHSMLFPSPAPTNATISTTSASSNPSVKISGSNVINSTSPVISPSFTPITNFSFPQPTIEPDGSASGDDNMYCTAGRDPVWRLLWPKTLVGRFAYKPCPPQFRGIAFRRCKLIGVWALPVLSQCVSENINGIRNEANTFFQSQPDISGALFLVNQLSNLTMPDMGMPLPSEDLSTLNYIVGQTVNLMLQQGGPGSNQGADVVDALNNALEPQNAEGWANLQESQSGSEELLSNTEGYARYLARSLNDSNGETRYSRGNIAIRARRYSRFAKFSDSIFPFDEDLTNTSGIDPANRILIPAAYLEALANATADGEISVVHVLFSSLNEFLPTADNETSPASIIISSQVVTSDNETSINSTVNSILLESPIELTFSINVTYNTSIQKIIPHCVYWNFSSDFNSTNYGGWASDNVFTNDELINDTIVQCYSYHLTSFAVLVSVVEQDDLSNGTETTLEEHFLSIVSYIGCSISIVCLIATIICLLTLKMDLIQKPIHFIHFNLSIALLIALILFVSTIETATAIPELCKAVTFLMHYFFLSAFSWMFCEALMLYLLVIIVFSRLAKMWWFYLLLGWGLPIIPVVITFGIKFDSYTSDQFCWLSIDDGVIWGFVGPIIGVICINTVILVIVLIKILRAIYSKQRINNKDDKKEKKTNKLAFDVMKNIVILLPLLGLTWIVGIFAVNNNTTVFAWIFVILNSLQGAFIFLLHVFKGPLIWGRFKKWHKRHKRKMDFEKSPYSMSQSTTKSSKVKLEISAL